MYLTDFSGMNINPLTLTNMDFSGRLMALIRNLYSEDILQIHTPGSFIILNTIRVRRDVRQGSLFNFNIYMLFILARTVNLLLLS